MAFSRDFYSNHTISISFRKELLNWFFTFQTSQVQLSNAALMLWLGFANDFLFNILQDKLIPVQLGSKCVESIW